MVVVEDGIRVGKRAGVIGAIHAHQGQFPSAVLNTLGIFFVRYDFQIHRRARQLFNLLLDGLGHRLPLRGDHQIHRGQIGAEIGGHRLRLGHIVREQVGQILISRFQRADRTSQRTAGVWLRGGDAGRIDEVSECGTHILIGHNRIGIVVERQQHLICGGAFGDGQTVLAVHLRCHGGGGGCDHIDSALGYGIGQQRLIGILGECHGTDVRLGAVVAPVVIERQRLPRRELANGERAGTYCLLGIVGIARFGIVHNAQSAGQGT